MKIDFPLKDIPIFTQLVLKWGVTDKRIFGQDKNFRTHKNIHPIINVISVSVE